MCVRAGRRFQRTAFHGLGRPWPLFSRPWTPASRSRSSFALAARPRPPRPRRQSRLRPRPSYVATLGSTRSPPSCARGRALRLHTPPYATWRCPRLAVLTSTSTPRRVPSRVSPRRRSHARRCARPTPTASRRSRHSRSTWDRSGRARGRTSAGPSSGTAAGPVVAPATTYAKAPWAADGRRPRTASPSSSSGISLCSAVRASRRDRTRSLHSHRIHALRPRTSRRRACFRRGCASMSKA